MGLLREFDVIICGGGHAGCEAALASARVGANTLLLTNNIDDLGKMSCNPAIGGLAKGNIVREIDALGGEMGINADTTAIQFRLLNRSKGLSVQGPRAQCDKDFYRLRMKSKLLKQRKHLSIFQSVVTGLLIKNDKVIGVTSDVGVNFYSTSVVLTSGTFLNGLIHIGKTKIVGGRLGDFSSNQLAENLLQCGINLERMKTGTPPRILGETIDFSLCDEQKGDQQPCLFAFYDTRCDNVCRDVISFSNDLLSCNILGGGTRRQKSCWITHTTEETQRVIENNISRSPLYSGEINGIGPRYCPSIEDKYVKFPDHGIHQIFLEPEGYQSDEWYINGLSSSMPVDVQMEILSSVPALKNAKISRPAYAVEYDFAPPTQIDATLQSKVIENLFFAGQINGTSGYEEAAGQGLVAGVNAGRKALGASMMVLGRHDAYIGVLIDDLVTKGTIEPYRMFTSRAEYRLLLNHGSADVRLLKFAEEFNLLDVDRLAATKNKLNRIEFWQGRLQRDMFEGRTIADWLTQARDKETIAFPSSFYGEPATVQEEVIYRIRYSGYIAREQRMIAKTAELDNVKLPKDFDYSQVKSLSNEARQKLTKYKPITLGQASRISGIAPVDISLLLVTLEKAKKR